MFRSALHPKFRNFVLLVLFALFTALPSTGQIDSAVYEKLNRAIRNNPQKATALLAQLKAVTGENIYSKQQLDVAEIRHLTSQGEYDLAMQGCIESLNNLKDTIPETYVGYITCLGNIYYFTRQRKSAIDYYLAGLKYIEENQLDPHLAAKLHSNLGGMYAEESMFEKSKFHLEKSIELFNIYQPNSHTSLPYRLLGTNYWMQDRFVESRPILRNAIRKATAYGDSLEIAGALVFYGDLMQKLNVLDSAEYYYLYGLRVVQGTDNPDMKLEAFIHLKNLYPLFGKYKAAHAFADSAYYIQTAIYRRNLAEQISQMKIRYETDKLQQENETRTAQLETEITKSRLRLVLIITLIIAILIVGSIAYILITQQRLKRQAAEQNSIIKLQEERLRISRELHDNIGAQITVIISSLDNLEWQAKKQTAIDHDQIEKLSSFTRQTMQELRETVWAMKKDSITGEELDARIKDYMYKVAELCPAINLIYNSEDKGDFKFDPAQGINLYRIIQEAVQNSIKHGEATEITVTTFMDGATLKAKIDDNGRGFDPETVEKGNGLYNMENRALQSQIGYKLKSTVNKGTTILLEVAG